MVNCCCSRAFRDPDTCDWSAIDKFPPNPQIPFPVIVFNRFIEIWDIERGTNLLCRSDTAMTKDERLTQLVDRRCCDGIDCCLGGPEKSRPMACSCVIHCLYSVTRAVNLATYNRLLASVSALPAWVRYQCLNGTEKAHCLRIRIHSAFFM